MAGRLGVLRGWAFARDENDLLMYVSPLSIVY